MQRIEDRLRRDCFLHPATTYQGFSYDFTLNLKLRDTNFGKQTLVWDKHTEGTKPDANAQVDAAEEKFDSGDSPNKTRIEHDLPIPVETQEGRHKVIRHRKFPKEEVPA